MGASLNRPLKRTSATGTGEKGAYLVELAIALPVYLVFVFVIIDVARIGLVTSALRSAVYFGTRQAVAPLRKEWSEVAAAFDALGDPASVPASNVAATMNSVPEFRSSDGESSNWYQCTALVGSTGCPEAGADGRVAIGNVFRIEASAIAIANSVLSENIGGIRYPCEGEANCARCFTLRGDPDDYDRWFKYFEHSWAARSLAIRCRYDLPILSAGLFLGAFPSYWTLSSDYYHTVDYLPLVYFEP